MSTVAGEFHPRDAWRAARGALTDIPGRIAARPWRHDLRTAGRFVLAVPRNWILERSRTASTVSTLFFIALIPTLHFAIGLGVVGTLVVNAVGSRVPMAVSLVAAAYRRNWDRFMNPQRYQGPGGTPVFEGARTPGRAVTRVDEAGPGPDPAMPDATIPADATWKLYGWQRGIVEAAQRGNRVAVAVDMFLFERNRIPGLVADIVTFALGPLALGPLTVFAVNWAVKGVPLLNSLSISLRNHSWGRFDRPGAYAGRRRGARHDPAPDVNPWTAAPEVDATALHAGAARAVEPAGVAAPPPSTTAAPATATHRSWLRRVCGTRPIVRSREAAARHAPTVTPATVPLRDVTL